MTTKDADFFLIENLAAHLPGIPEDSIISKQVFDNDSVRAVLFGFAAGQQLSEHTSSHAAILHFITGEATVTLGDETMKLGPGGWVHMVPNLPHSVVAEQETVMLLLLLK